MDWEENGDAPTEAEEAELKEHDSASKKRKNKSSHLISLVEDSIELFHSPDKEAFVKIFVEDHFEYHALKKKSFKQYLSHRFYKKTGDSIGSQPLQDAVMTLQGKALFDSPEQKVFIRIAGSNGNIYLDLADDKWRCVEITSRGWNVIDNSPIAFVRGSSMLPLPLPTRDGSYATLKNFVNLTDENFVLYIAWLIGSHKPDGPYPILSFYAEQGSGKSTAARISRELLDPNTAPLRSEPREPRDLMIAATNSWVICLDNLSKVPVWLSDALCRLSTGGGFSTRALYSDSDEQIFDAKRPIMLTGIEELCVRGDLLDRSLIINLPTIPESRRKTEKEFWKEFYEVRPGIIGSLLDAVSGALKNESSIALASLPRMADFAKFVAAAEPALGWRPGTFQEKFTGNRESANELVLESSSVATAILEFVSDYWEGTAGELLTELSDATDDATVKKRERDKSFPKSPRALSNALRRLAPNLRATGLDVEFSREVTKKRKRIISLTRNGIEGESCVRSVRTVQNANQSQEIADDTDVDHQFSDARNSQKTLERTQTDVTDERKQSLSTFGPDDIATDEENPFDD